MSDLASKLKPSRFPGMSPFMAAIVGYVLGESFTQPEIAEIAVSEDENLVYVRRAGAGHVLTWEFGAAARAGESANMSTLIKRLLTGNYGESGTCYLCLAMALPDKLRTLSNADGQSIRFSALSSTRSGLFGALHAINNTPLRGLLPVTSFLSRTVMAQNSPGSGEIVVPEQSGPTVSNEFALVPAIVTLAILSPPGP